ncbi:MAG: hypothetical protein PWQ85_1613 [Geotoga sp.]|nr:hypothetical protein [Geotoga sp.]
MADENKQRNRLSCRNTYHVNKSKEFDDNSPGKSDRKDAGVIGRLIRDGRYFDIYLPHNKRT